MASPRMDIINQAPVDFFGVGHPAGMSIPSSSSLCRPGWGGFWAASELEAEAGVRNSISAA